TQVSALGAAQADTEAITLRLGGLAPLAGAATAAVLAWVLVAEGWRPAAADRLRTLADFPENNAVPYLKVRQTALTAAAKRHPARAELHVEAGLAYLAGFEEELDTLAVAEQRHVAVQAVAAG